MLLNLCFSLHSSTQNTYGEPIKPLTTLIEPLRSTRITSTPTNAFVKLRLLLETRKKLYCRWAAQRRPPMNLPSSGRVSENFTRRLLSSLIARPSRTKSRGQMKSLKRPPNMLEMTRPFSKTLPITTPQPNKSRRPFRSTCVCWNSSRTIRMREKNSQLVLF